MSLQLCRECGANVSTEATACPSCGCPQQSASVRKEASKSEIKQKSHIYGWVALIAFLMSCFTPAILAPIVVLAAFVLAALEIKQGSKYFGGILFVFCTMQAWFIADHFGGISGSIGITNPKQIEEDAARKYSATNSGIPTDANQIIQQKCAEKWPRDFEMRDYCQKQQREGIAALSHGKPTLVSKEAFIIIRGKCAEKWPRDFEMRAYCESQQYDGYQSLQATAQDHSRRGSCAQKWPDDYEMRKYCESQR